MRRESGDVVSTVVIYHANCPDGFAAAWSARRAHPGSAVSGDIEFVPAQYGDAPPDVTGKHVVVVDFSFPRSVLLEMDTKANSMVVLDHHKTAQKDLAGLPFCVFDMDRSGARIAWEHWFGTEDVPALIRYVEDRDLWRFALPWSREVSAYMSTLPRTFEALDDLHSRLEDEGVRVVGELGSIALRVTSQYVQAQLPRAQTVRIYGYDVPCINTTFAVSELVGELAKSTPFAAGWFQREDGKFVYSLRSSADSSVDVSAIAKYYGGGGHAHAAGFTTDTLHEPIQGEPE